MSIVFHSNQIAPKPQVFGLREQDFLKAKFSDTTASIIQKPEEHQSIWNISLDTRHPNTETEKVALRHLDSQNTPKLPHLRRDLFGCFSPIHLNIVSSPCFFPKTYPTFEALNKTWKSSEKTWGYITPKNEGNVGNPHPSFVGLAWPTGLTT